MQPSIVENAERKLADILFVEDSHADITLIKAILKINKIHFSFHFLYDGEEAMKLLSSQDPIVKNINLIFVDFNLPKSNGFDILSFVKSHQALEHIPVIILSGSDEENDIARALDLGAATYIVKPLLPDKLEAAVNNIKTLDFHCDDEHKYIYAVP